MITEYTIDAKDRTIGRIASEAASIIMGKNKSSFVKNAAPEVRVNIINASKTKITAKKMAKKEYYRFTGYPGGRKSETLSKIIQNKGFSEVFKLALYGMLPKNKLRKIMLKNLNITD